MTKETFKELTGEDPEDMFGPDWWNELHALASDEDDIQINEDDDLEDPIFQEDDDEDNCDEND